jgi:hypothetical protein
MSSKRLEFVVDNRDDHGRPAIIRLHEVDEPSDRKKDDDKKLSKKRLRERQALKLKDQHYLQTLFQFPKQLEAVRQLRGETESALTSEISALKKTQEEKNIKKDSGDTPTELAERRYFRPQVVGETRELTAEDEERIKGVYLVPQALENLRKEGREPSDQALRTELLRLLKDKKNEVAASSPSLAAPKSETCKVGFIVPSQPGSWMAIYLSFFLSVVFFLMALFPSFRSFVIRDFIVNFLIGAVAPPLLRSACTLGEQFSERLPLISFLIVSLYNVFGFWVLAAGVTWATWNFWIVLKVTGLSIRALAKAMAGRLKGVLRNFRKS